MPGMMFPEAELLGVDIVIPDITYLKQNRQHLRAILLTHGHEDHIGALPYILRDLNAPIYGTRFTLALVHKRLEEHGLLDKTDLREVIPGRKLEVGPFEVEFISVTHSTIDCVALAIRTPVGIVIHTGDFKMDPTPIDGQPFDLHAFARYGAGRRAGAVQRQHKRRAPRLHAVGANRPPAHRGTDARGDAQGDRLLLRLVDPAHPADREHRRGRGPQGRVSSAAAWWITSRSRTA